MISRALLDQVAVIAGAAGERILDVYGTNFAVDAKNDASPVTAADLAAHREIVARLGKLEPALPILSEESATVSYAERARWTRYWLVDPLDGTREFVKRNGEFTVNIALVDDGAPVLGVVHVPVTGVTYLAARGVGAFRAEAGTAPVPIRVRLPAAKPPVVVGSRSHAGTSLVRYLAALGEHELVSVGSSLKFCLVAEGAADCYPRFGPTSEWDTAAAQCVAEVAGADVTDLGGLRLRYNTGESLLNPHFIVCADPSFRAALQGR